MQPQFIPTIDNTIKMRKLFIMLAMAFVTVIAKAGSIEGRIIDSQKQPLEFVNVILYQIDGTTLVKGTITDSDGRYTIPNVKDGSYKISFQFVGYITITRSVTLSEQNNHKIALKSIVLEEDSEQLEEVAVVAQKQTMKLDIDKKVFNVDQDIASVGGSASEVLENIPSVEVDAEGNVSLRGSSSVTVWINGKAQGMTSDNRGDILEQMPAESIERIEVITNPSSKYSPEGSAGIINIVLKRDRKAGYYGGVKVSANTNKGGRFGANINYSSGILDAYANIGYARRINKSGGYTDRDNLNSDFVAVSYLNSTNKSRNEGNNIFARAGFTWHITQHDDFSIGYMGMFGNGDRDQTYNYTSADYNGYNTIGYRMNRDRINTSSDDMRMNDIEVGYRHEWKTGHSIDLTVSRNKWSRDGNSIYDQTSDYFDMETDTFLNKIISYQNTDSKMDNNSWDIQLDYEQPIGEKSKIEAGYKGTFFDEDAPTETYENEEKTKSIESLFNRFIYNSDVHAVYANWQSTIGEHLGYQVGLRGEAWSVDTKSHDYNAEYRNGSIETFSKSYFKIFPTLFMSYKISETQELQLNYTRRLQRPFGGLLNSFKNISDSTNISYGNPELTPEYTNSYEFNYIKNWDNHTISLSAYYRPSDDVIQRISYIDNGIRYQTSKNVTRSLSSGLEIIGKNRLWTRLDLTTTVNFFYYSLDGGDYTFTLDNGTPYAVNIQSSSDFSWNARFMASLLLPYQISYQATFNYNAPQVITQGKRDASYSLDMGLRKTFFDKKLTIALNGRDLLDSRKWHSKTEGIGFSQDQENWRGGRRAILQIAWSFGNMKNDKKKDNKNGQDDNDEDNNSLGGYNDSGE